MRILGWNTNNIPCMLVYIKTGEKGLHTQPKYTLQSKIPKMKNFFAKCTGDY